MGFAAGVDAGNALGDTLRKEMVYNALSQAYGPGAGAVQTLGADLAGKAATTANTQAEANTRNALLPGVAAAQSAQTGNLQATAAETQQKVAQQRLGTAVQIAQAALRGDPTLDPGALYDTLTPALKGAHPEFTDEALANNRAAFVKDPQGFISGLTGAKPEGGVALGPNGQPVFTTTDPNVGIPKPVESNVSPFAPPEGAPIITTDAQGNQYALQKDKFGQFHSVPLPSGQKTVQSEQTGQRIVIQSENAQTARERLTGEAAPAPGGTPATTVPGSGDRAAIAPTSRYARLVTQKDKDAANDLAKQSINVADGVAQAKPILQQTLQQISPYTAGPGTLLSSLPGSVQNNLKRNLETLKANEFLSVLGSMKNSRGQAGVGRVLQAEVPMMQAAYGNMAQDQTVGQLAQHISLLSQLLDRSQQKAIGGFKAAYGADPYDVAGVKPYSPVMTTPATGATAIANAPRTRPITSGPYKGGTAVSNDGGKTWQLQ